MIEEGTKVNRFCSRGYRFLSECPICLREMLSVADARELRDAIVRADGELVEQLNMKHSNIISFQPIDLEIAQLFNWRFAVVPVCKTHRNVDHHKVQQAIVLTARYARIIKGDPHHDR